jgi:DNA helicase II / ATP-dependent DNA helicase PcrA
MRENMKTAHYQNQLISIEQLDREDFQKIYNAGKNGELSCPACQEKVRLYLGINKSPHFFHINSVEKECQDVLPILRSEEVQEHFIEQNGFRIPKGRTIVEEPRPNTVFNKKKMITSEIPFSLKNMPALKINQPIYLKKLEEFGVQLDESQSAAVMRTEGALLVLAGAGSGKTRVLTARTAYMLENNNIDPRSVMLVTFTSKAANEMKSRLLSYPQMNKAKVSQLVTGTFHSIFYRILLFHARDKWNTDKLLKKEWQRDKILKEAGKEIDLSEKEFAYDLALQQIGFWKNSLILPHEVRPASDWDEKAAFLYRKYEEYKANADMFDFDDMLIGCYQLFLASPQLLEQYQERFCYFLIDEFQDVNKVQYELIKLLSGKHQNVCAVGDDDQSIYSFRGSDPGYLLSFEKDFPEAKVITLDQNYRSSHEIVTTANQIIRLNKTRKIKKMKAQFSNGVTPVLFYPHDEEEEATMIVTDIQEKIANGAAPSDFAILFRTHAGSRAIFERLANSNLPFIIDSDAESFYDRRIVKSILAFLKLSLNEDDAHAFSDILPSLFLKQSALNDCKANSILNDCSLLEALGHLKLTHKFQEKKVKKVVELTRRLKYSSPSAAIETIEKEIGFQDFLKKRGDEASKLEKGSDDIKDLKVAAKNFDSINALLDHASHMSSMNKEIKNMRKHFSDAITLSTIHRAKGLEYNTVYIIGTVDGSIPHDYALNNADSRAIEEERRLLYVAVTRAKEQLYLSLPEKRRGKKAKSSRFLAPLKKEVKS